MNRITLENGVNISQLIAITTFVWVLSRTLLKTVQDTPLTGTSPWKTGQLVTLV